MNATTSERYSMAYLGQAVAKSSRAQTNKELAKFGAQIKRRRQAWFMSQRHLAMIAGTSQAVITRITHALPSAQLELQLYNDYSDR